MERLSEYWLVACVASCTFPFSGKNRSALKQKRHLHTHTYFRTTITQCRHQKTRQHALAQFSGGGPGFSGESSLNPKGKQWQAPVIDPKAEKWTGMQAFLASETKLCWGAK